VVHDSQAVAAILQPDDVDLPTIYTELGLNTESLLHLSTIGLVNYDFPYRDPNVAKNTSRSDFRIRDLMNYTDPVSLYIITQPNDKDRLRPLVRLVVNMIVRLLANKMEFENDRPKPTCKHKLLAMIDEFPAFGKLEILQQSLAFVAGYGIKCYLIAQDINQLKSRETGYGPDESITSNCHIQAAFPPNRLETAEHLSKLTGTTTIIKEKVTRSGRGFLGTQVSTTMQEVQRPLLTPDECQRMPGPRKDEHDRITAAGDMVIYCAGHPAIYGRQPLYFEDKTFAARAAIPAPTHSDSLSSLPVPEVKIDDSPLVLCENAQAFDGSSDVAQL
jgi:type IV secretion system protein VirD4